MNDTDRGPVRVTLNVSDWQKVPTRTYTKVVEFDREDWDMWDERVREEEIETLLREFKDDMFSADYEIED